MLKESTAQYSCIFNYNILYSQRCLKIRQLLFYLLFLNFFLTKSTSVRFIFSFKKTRKNILVFTKAPYRYKLSKHQFFFCRFLLFFKFSFFFITKTQEAVVALYRYVYAFCALDFCFFSLYFFKTSLWFSLKEWLS